MDLAKSQTDEIFQLKEYIKIFKLFAPIIHRSDLYRLWNPFKVCICLTDKCEYVCSCCCLVIKPFIYEIVLFIMKIVFDYCFNVCFL